MTQVPQISLKLQTAICRDSPKASYPVRSWLTPRATMYLQVHSAIPPISCRIASSIRCGNFDDILNFLRCSLCVLLLGCPSTLVKEEPLSIGTEMQQKVGEAFAESIQVGVIELDSSVLTPDKTAVRAFVETG